MSKFEIIIEDLRIHAIIGILEKERKKEQTLIINAVISYDYNGQFLDYVKIVEVIEDLLKNRKYQLLEEAILEINQVLRENFKIIHSLKISIKKPDILNHAIVGIEANYQS